MQITTMWRVTTMRTGVDSKSRRAMLALAVLFTPSLAIQCGGKTSPVRDAGDSGAPLGSMECRDNGDCTDTFARYCVQPHQPAGKGVPVVCNLVDKPGCASDSDCPADGGPLICDIAPGTCSPAVKTCTPGCTTASDCNEGEDCAAHRCVPRSCQQVGDCPTNFACTDGKCARRSCTSDAPCTGYCVVGSCYASPGTCTQPVP